MKFKVFRGVEISVHQDGSFSARVAGQRIEAETLKSLETQIQKSRKKARIELSIPITWTGWQLHEPKYARATWIYGPGVRHVTLVGIHSGNENLLVRDDLTGELTQETSMGVFHTWADPVRRLTDEEAAEYARLHEARSAADRAYHAFVAERRVDPRELIRQALADKIDDPGESEVEAELAEEGDPR